MSEELKEWVHKAEGDYFTARRELRARKNANYDSACFQPRNQMCLLQMRYQINNPYAL